MASKLNRNTNGCCVDGCYNKQKNSEFSFFTLPSHCETRNKWLEVIGRPDLLNKTSLKPQSYKICSVHFENSMMSEVLVRKLLPGTVVPTKFLSTKSQRSTSTCVKESQSSEVSTQTKHSYVEELSVVQIKNAFMAMGHTQTDNSINERETQTSLALSSGTKRRLVTHLQSESEKKKRRLPNGIDTTKKETDAKNSLLRSPFDNQSYNGDDDEVTEKFFKKVESSAGASVHYVPTLWYYKHMNFLSGKKDTDSDESDSDHNNETVYVRLPRVLKRPPTTSTDQEVEPERDQEGDPASSTDASAAAFGRSVGAQLHHLSKMQRCIAEKLISDVIYHAKMEQLSLDTSINVKEAVEGQAATLIPKAGPLYTAEDLVRREIEETQSAVNFIKMDRDVTESYVFQDDEDELSHAIDIVKEELM